ncbi:MAG: ThiF family adenylyltransferase [Bdellovibrionota bacterium]|nr:ThiF family adenylyltransferase [Bdellovibrionota bacterium]
MKKPLFPSYLRINNISLFSEKPLVFEVFLGRSNVTEEIIQLKDYELYILSLSEGLFTVCELREKTLAEFNISSDEFNKSFEQLKKVSLLIDGTENKAAMPNQDDRYARHMLFYESIGLNGGSIQETISGKKIAIIGAGGIGTWLSYNLSASGVLDIKIIDSDIIEESNLTRQVLYTYEDIGTLKVDACKKRIEERNPNVKVTAIPKKIYSLEDMENFVGDVDLILLAGDGPHEINLIINEYAYKKGIAWSRAGYHHQTAICGPFLIPGENQCYECLTDLKKPQKKLPYVSDINNRYQTPSFGPVNGIASTLLAKEAICYLGEIESWVVTSGKMNAFDVHSLQSEIIEVDIDQNEDCPHCSKHFLK